MNERPGGLIIREATAADLPAVAAIYNHFVAHSTCTFATEPEGEAYWSNWLATHHGAHPAIVAVRDGEVVGWGTLSRWNSRCAYRQTVENSVYVRHDVHRAGIGRRMLEELIRRARELKHRQIIAQIADDQDASKALHRSLGFAEVGVLREVGFKFGRWLDVGLWQLTL